MMAGLLAWTMAAVTVVLIVESLVPTRVDWTE